jgi:hypothetical protein
VGISIGEGGALTSGQATFNEFLPCHFVVLYRLLLRAGKLEV